MFHFHAINNYKVYSSGGSVVVSALKGARKISLTKKVLLSSSQKRQHHHRQQQHHHHHETAVVSTVDDSNLTTTTTTTIDTTTLQRHRRSMSTDTLTNTSTYEEQVKAQEEEISKNFNAVVPTQLPSSNATVDSKNSNEIRLIATAFCPSLVVSNQQQQVTSVSELLLVRPLSGGLSNEIFIVSNTQFSVLVRIHPTTTSVNHEYETNLLHWLSSSSSSSEVLGAPRIYGKFGNGRVEEFYPNAIPLSCTTTMITRTKQIGTILGTLHSTTAVPEYIVKESVDIWTRVGTWLHSIQQAPQQTETELLELLVQTAWEWICTSTTLRRSIDTCSTKTLVESFLSQHVLTHMDCQSLNLLQVPTTNSNASGTSTSSLKLIDYEYAGTNNERGIDIANTFCEYCNMNSIAGLYDSEYPSVQTQNDFITSYMSAVSSSTRSSSSSSSTTDTDNDDDKQEEQEVIDSLVKILTTDVTDAKERALSEFRHRIGQYTLISHISWSIWGILQASNNDSTTIDFDYRAYAKHRYDGYVYFKNQYYTN